MRIVRQHLIEFAVEHDHALGTAQLGCTAVAAPPNTAVIKHHRCERTGDGEHDQSTSRLLGGRNDLSRGPNVLGGRRPLRHLGCSADRGDEHRHYDTTSTSTASPSTTVTIADRSITTSTLDEVTRCWSNRTVARGPSTLMLSHDHPRHLAGVDSALAFQRCGSQGADRLVVGQEAQSFELSGV